MVYKLSVRALKDVEQLFLYSIEKFGVQQAENYVQTLEQTFQLLADFPTIGRNAGHIRPELRAHAHQSHTIYYRIKTNHIFIVRVLSNKMDHPRHM